jgi:CheY-like chemotaxis protein
MMVMVSVDSEDLGSTSVAAAPTAMLPSEEGGGDSVPPGEFGDDEVLHGDDSTEIPLAVHRFDIPDGLPAEGPTRILVVGAAPEIREETVVVLRTDGGPGWEPDAVGEEASARTKLMLETWDLVLLRLDAGPLDYRHVFRSIRAARKWPAPRVVAVLPPDLEVQSELRGMGATRVLTTPVTAQEIIEAVHLGLATDGPSSAPWWDTDHGESGEHDLEDPRV